MGLEKVNGLRSFERMAIDSIEARSAHSVHEDILFLNELLGEPADSLIDSIFNNCCVTLNFHPDLLSYNGKTVIENIYTDGLYYSQFKTKVTNGAKSAYPGGSRYLWESELFGGAYDMPDVSDDFRPKYGSLNIMRYIDGASPRFGSCYFVLNKEVSQRCTFTYGDSHLKPKYVGTQAVFYSALRAIFQSVAESGRLFVSDGYDVLTASAYLRGLADNEADGRFGRVLDDYVEAQIHGDIHMLTDVEAVFVDDSFHGTKTGEILNELSVKFNIKLHWIPARKIHVEIIPDEFRGPRIKPLARRIVTEFGSGDGIVDANLVGMASQQTVMNPDMWSDFGTKAELFQYIKQLWHVLAYYGGD